jgi:cyclopropane fatty-acyl-phospholipid synthase-like methyltransferase
MYQNIEQQKNYWNKEVGNFDSIYSHKKSGFKNYLDKKLRWDMYERFDYTMRKSEPIKDKTILDVGCGTGRFVFEFIKRQAQKVIGIDIAPGMINTCKETADKLNINDKCEFFISDPFEYKTNLKFDICIGIGLFDYIIDPLPVIKRMKELTTGRIILSFPKKGTFRAFIRKIRLNSRNCDVYFFTPEQIDRYLKDAGLEKYDFEQFGQLYCVTAYV